MCVLGECEQSLQNNQAAEEKMIKHQVWFLLLPIVE